jgi:F0F1-type ATP synthase assembly protein I
MLGGTGNRKELGRLMAISQVGLEMVAPIALAVFIDIQLGLLPWITLVGILVGLVGGMTHLIWLANQEDKNTKDSSTKNTAQS